MKALNTIDQIKRANRDAGKFWFSPDTLRFFRSRVSEIVYPCERERVTYFVSSEVPPNGKRCYSVRVVDWNTAAIDTVGEFRQYRTARDAHKAALKLSSE